MAWFLLTPQDAFPNRTPDSRPRGHSDLPRRAVSYDLSGERLTERGLSGRPHPAPGPRTRRASAGQSYIRWFFRQYYRDPVEQQHLGELPTPHGPFRAYLGRTPP